jgi:Cft2 family RNA processing exonuclease
MKESMSWVKNQLESGQSVTTLGYSLGKAQVLCAMMEQLGFPVFIHGSILKMNSIYSQLGVELHGFIPYTEAKKNGYFDNGPYVLVSPQKMDLETLNAKFTGWAMTRRFNSDAAFPLSDHAGYDELLETVRKVDPSMVFTVHGFKEEFAERLRQEGYRAIPMSSHQMKLADFV